MPTSKYQSLAQSLSLLYLRHSFAIHFAFYLDRDWVALRWKRNKRRCGVCKVILLWAWARWHSTDSTIFLLHCDYYLRCCFCCCCSFLCNQCIWFTVLFGIPLQSLSCSARHFHVRVSVYRWHAAAAALRIIEIMTDFMELMQLFRAYEVSY